LYIKREQACDQYRDLTTLSLDAVTEKMKVQDQISKVKNTLLEHDTKRKGLVLEQGMNKTI